jgi:type VI secretion system protein VasG
MIDLDLRKLFDRLSPFCRRALEAAAGQAVSRGHYEVTVEHLVLALVEEADHDVALIVAAAGADPAAVAQALRRAVEAMRTGNTGRPVFAPPLVSLLSDAWLVASVELGLARIRSGALLLAALSAPGRLAGDDWLDRLRPLTAAELKRRFGEWTAASREEAAPLAAGDAPTAPAGAGGLDPEGMLARFTVNFTAQARAGRIDPVFCRDREIQQMVDILGRRRKNNPICVGDPGVGKTAVVEGLALRIVEGDVPEFLRAVELVGLDLGMLQAGASVKGEFENRLKGVIEEVKASAKPIVLFIDEAHTLVGAGGAAGGSDAANLLKPALARGELRTIAATTWSEYKKYFEKDPALARRFQLVKLDEPSPEEAATILRGLRPAYEKSHGVYIRDDAVAAAAALSARYISGRQLPDKAVDVLDTAAARVKLSLGTRPPALAERRQQAAALRRERLALARDAATGRVDGAGRLAEIDAAVVRLETEAAEIEARWTTEKGLVDRVLALRAEQRAEEAADASAGEPADAAAADGSPAAAAEGGECAPAPEEERRAALAEALDALKAAQGRDPLLHYEVTPDAVGAVISDWTGIAVGRMVRDEAASLLSLGRDLGRRIKGQDHAVAALEESLRAAKAGIQDPDRPLGVFLFVGPSGVGKTELALALADLLFGGERFLVTINMSEFQEKHTVSKLVGSPPGYVGYGEGGVLTEAVRQRPYSVVLLDEVEKADLEVMNLFYQVFDKGTLADGEGRVVDFRNTVVILTSNLATDIVTAMGLAEARPGAEEVADAIRPVLSRHFKPALLARMQVVPFFPLRPAELAAIARLKLDRVASRIAASHKVACRVSDALVEAIVARATEVESGARAIDQIIRRGLLPAIATEILSRMADGGALAGLVLDVGPDGGFVFGSGGSDEAAAETDAEAPARGDAADADATEPTAAVA